MSANETRGEFSIELDGMTHIMRPTWEAILDFETALGKSLITLARNAASGDLTVREIATIVAICIRAYGRVSGETSHANVNDKAVTRCIVALGALKALGAVQPLLLLAATGGVTAEGEAKAPPAIAPAEEPGIATGA